MDEELAALAEAQGGVLSRAQLQRHGVPASRLGAVGSGRPHVQLRRGAYVRADVLEAAGQADLVRLAVAAARLTTGVDLVAVGRTAALVHDLPVLGRPPRLQLAERKDLRPRHHGQSRQLPAADLDAVGGVPVTSLARTAVDVARGGFARGVITADAVLRREVSREQLDEVVDCSRRWPGRLTAVDVVAFADARSESALESLGRVRFHEHDVPAPDLQVLICDDDGPFARVDHCWDEQRTVAEADGALKYADVTALFAEKQREDRLREAGWEVVRCTWDEVLRTPAAVVARVLRAFARAQRRAA